jgi:thiol:disulfide interchange protein
MSQPQIVKAIYAVLLILSAFFVAERVVRGAWSAALWPSLIAAFCVYRLVTMDDDAGA